MASRQRAGRTLTFVVTVKDALLVYVHGGSDPTIERIFGPTVASQLNLMRCWGTCGGKELNWRLVVYSTLVGASPFRCPLSEVSAPLMSICRYQEKLSGPWSRQHLSARS